MLKRKKVLVILSIFLVIFIIITTLVLLFIISQKDQVENNTNNNKNKDEFSISLEEFTKNTLNLDTPPQELTNLISILNDPRKSQVEKYKALSNFEYGLSATYVLKHDPKVREFAINILDPYATKNFPDLHTKGSFVFPCSDTTCGQELTKELVEVSQIIQKSSIPDEDKKTIITNLTTVGQTPDTEKDEKVLGYGIVYNQLVKLNNNDTTKAASLLKMYVKKRHNIDL